VSYYTATDTLNCSIVVIAAGWNY